MANIVTRDSNGLVASLVSNYLMSAEVAWINHEPTRTSAESSVVRKDSFGGKALLLEGDNHEVVNCVIPSTMKLNSKLLRIFLRWRRCAFLTTEELWQKFGLLPGSVPPFGHPLLDVRLLCDVKLLAQSKISFNAGLLTRSASMSVEQWSQFANPEVGCFVNEF